MTSKAFVRATRPGAYGLILKQTAPEELLGCSIQPLVPPLRSEELNRTVTLLANPTNAAPYLTLAGWVRDREHFPMLFDVRLREIHCPILYLCLDKPAFFR